MVHLPQPSVWPVVVAAGIALIAFGLLTSLVFTLLGAVVLASGVWGWVGELLHASG